MQSAESVNRVRGALLPQLRLLGLLLALGCVGGAIYSVQVVGREDRGWWLLGAGLVVAVLSQIGLHLSGSGRDPAAVTTTRLRVVLGLLLAVCGAALWGWASYKLYANWVVNFDSTWVAWVVASLVLSVGLDVAWGRWRTSRARPGRAWGMCMVALALLVACGVYRLGNLSTFPGEGHVSQVEELQTGNWGLGYLQGARGRWEYLSHVWLAALGIKLGGPTLLAMRAPFTTASVLETVPLFLWLHFAVGPVGAIAGTALFVFSFWDTVMSRLMNNHNALVVATVFALLAGPARRGRPSAYVWMGLLGGYILYEDVAYRPRALFALVGGTLMSFRDRTVSWILRVFRPLLTLLLIVGMTLPLVLNLYARNRLADEYLNGWNRAKVQEPYYLPSATWQSTAAKRLDRSAMAVALFFFHGDASPVHNIGGHAQVDPVTGALMLLGIAYCIAHLLRGVFGLTVVAFLLTLAGALVVTGNFDVGRAGGTVPYAFALAGVGAASLSATLAGAWGRIGRLGALAALSGAVLVAGYLNTTWMFEFWRSPLVHQHYRRELAYLSTWLREHVQPGERVVGVVPTDWNVLLPNDAAWLRGGELPGKVSFDIEDVLRDWAAHPGKALLMVAAGPTTRPITEYLQWLIPDLQIQWQPDPDGFDGVVAYAHLPKLPDTLAKHLAQWSCHAAHTDFQVIGTNGEVLDQLTGAAPYIDRTTWPTAICSAANRAEQHGKQVHAVFRTTFAVQTPGSYGFAFETYGGFTTLRLDGELRSSNINAPVALQPGPHTLEVNGTFDSHADGAMTRLLWKGPDSGGQTELMPLYRLVVPDPPCADGTPAEPAGPANG